MKPITVKLLIVALVSGIILTAVSGIPVRWLWSSPGGSAYGAGFPEAYVNEYCGGYAPCYWTPLYALALAEDVAFWFFIATAFLYALKWKVPNLF